MATAYKAKLLCSGIFVSEREASVLLSEDLAVDDLAPLRLLRSAIDFQQKTVTVSCFGGFKRTALYRTGLGSTLVIGTTVAKLREQSAAFEKWQQTRQYRHGQALSAKEMSSGIDAERLARVVDAVFMEPDKTRLQRSRAVVILHQGQIIAERYAAGFSAQTPLLGWSMAKSVVNALIGILVQQGKLALDSQDLLPEWRSPNDSHAPRRNITLDHLLRMSSGLSFSEDYANPLSDVTTMLFQRGDGAKYAAQLPLKNAPDREFSYAGGATVLLCRIIRQAVGGTLTDYFSFPGRSLFERIGMTSAVLEPDAAGTFTGSSFMYATARDWAKLGLLYLQDGCWQIESEWVRILPAGWVAYSTTPSKTADFYGAHFWLGVPNSFVSETSKAQRQENLTWPKGAYLAAGYQGQFVTVVPDCDLVVVRLGLSQRRNSWDHLSFISQVRQCFKDFRKAEAI
ncbi:MAG: serine hydrolase [Phormidesmis sp.]